VLTIVNEANLRSLEERIERLRRIRCCVDGDENERGRVGRSLTEKSTGCKWASTSVQVERRRLDGRKPSRACQGDSVEPRQ